MISVPFACLAQFADNLFCGQSMVAVKRELGVAPRSRLLTMEYSSSCLVTFL